MAFTECSRGKRKSMGYKNFLFAYGEKLKSIELELKSSNDYKWSTYRDFHVYDPKKRLIMAAPFKDRIVHTAIHRVIEPIIDPYLGSRSYACRTGMGNRNAVVKLFEQLKFMGEKRYCIKLDVRKYFESIEHNILLNNFFRYLPDDSTHKLLRGLVSSHEKYRDKKRGLPIGNLTSQLFANFHLRDFDYFACELLNLNFYEENHPKENFYIRYMDDSVILTRSKEKSFMVANALIKFATEKLELNIPNEKKVILANDPIPFLGFVLNEKEYRTLRRNERKFGNKLRRCVKNNVPYSKRAQIIGSYEAWRNLKV
jgi:RNA-directed DNA polymerase